MPRMKLLWPVLLLLGRSVYLLYALWCLAFPLALVGLLVFLPPFLTRWHLAAHLLASALALAAALVLWLVYRRRSADDPQPFQSAFLAWFGTLKWFGNQIAGAKVQLALPSGYLVENPGGYRLGGRDTREVLTLLQPGDILLRGYRGYLDGLFIRLASRCAGQGFRPGWYTHAALYLGPLAAADASRVPAAVALDAAYFQTGPTQVVHSMAKGVHTEDILTFLRCDYLCVLRLPAHLQPHVGALVDSALGKIGHAYDFNSDDTSRFHRFSCSELVYYCLRSLHTELGLAPTEHALFPLPRLFPTLRLLQRMTVVPDDFYELAERGALACVWEDSTSRSVHSQHTALL